MQQDEGPMSSDGFAEGAYVLVVGGSPEPSSTRLIREIAAGAMAIVAVDHGLDALLSAGVSCDLFCGDGDSVGLRARGAVRAAERGDSARVGSVERYDPYKDFTDLSLALRAIEERWGAVGIVCTCLSGGRPDHALAALGCLVRWDGKVQILEDDYTARVLHAGDAWHVRCKGGSTFSFVCLSPECVVSETGMEWELDRRRVGLLDDLGISNILGPDARFICHEGAVVAYLIA